MSGLAAQQNSGTLGRDDSTVCPEKRGEVEDPATSPPGIERSAQLSEVEPASAVR